jgi:hypothetical protein
MARRLLSASIVLAVATAATAAAVVLLASTNGDAGIGRLRPVAHVPHASTTPARPPLPGPSTVQDREHHHDEDSDD